LTLASLTAHNSAQYWYAKYHYAECHYAECRYAECRYAECHYAECRYAECRYAEHRYPECRGTLQRELSILSNYLIQTVVKKCLDVSDMEH
jgi:hypothetical protein